MLKLSHSLILRVISAFILMPVVLFSIVYGGVPFLLMVGVALGIAFKEWTAMGKGAGRNLFHGAAGYVYLTLCFLCFVHLRLNYVDGAGLALCLILSIWASDSAAYFAGKTFKGPKMAPGISPNKTWSGFIGGMAGSAAAFAVYALYVGHDLTRLSGFDLGILEGVSVITLLLIGASITVSGQAGDLLESFEKRRANVKDSGTLIPGHGGLLDRIDSLLLASPVFLLTLEVLGL